MLCQEPPKPCRPCLPPPPRRCAPWAKTWPLPGSGAGNPSGPGPSAWAFLVPTLIRMERGDPGVGVGIYATALWLMGRVNALPAVAAPAEDKGALESDVRSALKRRAVRSAASVEARLARGTRPKKQERS